MLIFDFSLFLFSLSSGRTYAFLISLIFIAPLAEIARYRPVLVIGVIGRIYVRVVLLFGSTLLWMQTTQIAFGIASAAEMVMFSYVYCISPRDKYQSMTGIIKATFLFGHVSSGFISQILVHFGVSIRYLIILGLVVACLALIISVFLLRQSKANMLSWTSIKTAFSSLKEIEFLSAVHYFLYCFFFVVVLATEQLVLNYMIVLFSAIDTSQTWNGAVDAVARLLGAVANLVLTLRIFSPHTASLSTVRKNALRTLFDFAMLTGFLVPIAAIIFVASRTTHLIVSYVCYALCYSGLDFIISFDSARIALGAAERFALVFSVNAFLSLGIQSGMQAFAQTLKLNIRDVFSLFGGILIALAAIFAFIAIPTIIVIAIIRERKRRPIEDPDQSYMLLT